MPKFTDRQVLELLNERLNELRRSLPSSDVDVDDPYLNFYFRGKRCMLDSIQTAFDFFSNYEFKLE